MQIKLKKLKNRKLGVVFLVIGFFLFGLVIGFDLGRNDCGLNKLTKSQDDFVGEYKVMRVIDGDTIQIAGGERVRYIGMDTPETVDPNLPVECYGPEATEENKKLVGGQTVRLEKDITNRDKYGRLLRYVYVGDTFVNLELVKEGYAKMANYPPDEKYNDEISQAQEEAKASGLGLWTACEN